MPSLIRGSTPILCLVFIGAYVVGFGLAALGIVLVYLGSTGSTQFSFFGQSFSSTNVGIPAVFLGAATVVLLIRRALKSVDTAIMGEAPRGPLSERGALEITHVGFTHESEFDVTVRNLGRVAVVISEIAIKMLKDHHIATAPILNPTATYKIPVDGMKEGETRTLSVSHVVNAHKADRFLIALGTTMIYTLEITLRYNQGEAVSFVRTTDA